MISEPDLLLEKFPRLARWFFLLCGTFLAVCAAAVAASGDVGGAAIASCLCLLLVSLFFLRNYILLDRGHREVRICFRWAFFRQERRIALASITQVYLRPLGKGGREIGLKLVNGSEVALCQPMGYASDKQELAEQLAQRLGVSVVQLPHSNPPVTTSHLVWISISGSAFSAAWGGVGWLMATKPATEGPVSWPGVWLISGFAVLILISTWRFTIREFQRRQRP